MKGIEIAPAHRVNHLAVRTIPECPDSCRDSRPCASPANGEIPGRGGGHGLPIDAVHCERGEGRPDLVIKPPDVGNDVGQPEGAPRDCNGAEPVGGQSAVKPLTFGASPWCVVTMPSRVLKTDIQGPANRIVVGARRVPLIRGVVCPLEARLVGVATPVPPDMY